MFHACLIIFYVRKFVPYLTSRFIEKKGPLLSSNPSKSLQTPHPPHPTYLLLLPTRIPCHPYPHHLFTLPILLTPPHHLSPSLTPNHPIQYMVKMFPSLEEHEGQLVHPSNRQLEYSLVGRPTAASHRSLLTITNNSMYCLSSSILSRDSMYRPYDNR